MAELDNRSGSPDNREGRATEVASSVVQSPTSRRALRAAEAQAAAATVKKPAPKLTSQARRKQVKKQTLSVVVMSFAAALVATMALPAYAFNPKGEEAAQFAASASQQLRSDAAQTMTVSNVVAISDVSRDGVSATSEKELADKKAAEEAAAAAAAAAEAAAEAATARRAEVAEQFSAYSGPSASDLLADPTYPDFDLDSVYGVATQYIGVPYVFGGATPSGFDCSGLVLYVFAQFGVSMPHSAAAQGAMGTEISRDDAVPGDLVIMDGHDGIYAGNGNILHAPYEGASVRVQPIWTDNYRIVRIGI